MKKKSILAMAMVFGLVGSTAFPVQADRYKLFR